MTTARLGDVVPALDDGSPDMNERVVICGATDAHGHVCHEPEWMPPHDWHLDSSGWNQWCGLCGGDSHAWDAPCPTQHAEVVREDIA